MRSPLLVPAVRIARRAVGGSRGVALALVCAAPIGLSACAVGTPKPVTGVSLTGATLHGDVYSSLDGNTDYWWRYGTTSAYGSETPHRTIAIGDRAAHPVSEPLTGLSAHATYHYQFCVKDAQARPDRICSGDQTFVAQPESGRIAFESVPPDDPNNTEVYSAFADGTNRTRLTYTPTGSNDLRQSFSPDGTKIAFSSDRGSSDQSLDIYVMDADGGNVTRLTSAPGYDDDPAWSPDGTKIAFDSDRSGDAEIYVMNANGSNVTRITSNPGIDSQPAWSPDGRKIAFRAERSPNLYTEIYSMNADGTSPTRLTSNEAHHQNPAWSPDGTEIAFDSEGGIWVMDPTGGHLTQLTSNPSGDSSPDWSPSGSKIAFDRCCESGSGPIIDVFTMNPDGSAQAMLIQGGFQPSWSVLP